MAEFSRIMLIDDNENDNIFHEIIMRQTGYTNEVAIFEEADKALAFLAASPAVPTLILLDINMPRMDGFEFARRAAPLLNDLAHVTVVMLSSSDDQSDKRKAEEIEVIRGYLVKPLTKHIAAELIQGKLDLVIW